MSGRIRTVKPEWLEDEALAAAGSNARVLSIALVLLADDYGRGRAHPAMLAGSVFAYEVNPVATLTAALEALTPWFIQVYEVRGQRYFEIRNWSKHQRVDKPGKERVPPPPDASDATAETPTQVAYFIRGEVTGLIKIGQSIDPVRRLADLAKCGSEPLSLLAIGGSERALHAELASDRVHGEWFKASPAVLAKIAEFGGFADCPIATATYVNGARVINNPLEDSRAIRESSRGGVESFAPDQDLIPHTSDHDRDLARETRVEPRPKPLTSAQAFERSMQPRKPSETHVTREDVASVFSDLRVAQKRGKYTRRECDHDRLTEIAAEANAEGDTRPSRLIVLREGILGYLAEPNKDRTYPLAFLAGKLSAYRALYRASSAASQPDNTSPLGRAQAARDAAEKACAAARQHRDSLAGQGGHAEAADAFRIAQRTLGDADDALELAKRGAAA